MTDQYMTAEKVVRAAINLETGGMGPKENESANDYSQRLTDRIVGLLQHNGMLNEAGWLTSPAKLAMDALLGGGK